MYTLVPRSNVYSVETVHIPNRLDEDDRNELATTRYLGKKVYFLMLRLSSYNSVGVFTMNYLWASPPPGSLPAHPDTRFKRASLHLVCTSAIY